MSFTSHEMPDGTFWQIIRVCGRLSSGRQGVCCNKPTENNTCRHHVDSPTCTLVQANELPKCGSSKYCDMEAAKLIIVNGKMHLAVPQCSECESPVTYEYEAATMCREHMQDEVIKNTSENPKRDRVEPDDELHLPVRKQKSGESDVVSEVQQFDAGLFQQNVVSATAPIYRRVDRTEEELKRIVPFIETLRPYDPKTRTAGSLPGAVYTITGKVDQTNRDVDKLRQDVDLLFDDLNRLRNEARANHDEVMEAFKKISIPAQPNGLQQLLAQLQPMQPMQQPSFIYNRKN